MNAFVGPSDIQGDGKWELGQNSWFPQFRQFLKEGDIRHPSSIWVTVDEHPDSINDGYFVDSPYERWESWMDLPASYHNGAAGFSFADGHSEIHKWLFESTKRPVTLTNPSLGAPPFPVPRGERGDLDWVFERMSVLLSE